MSTTSVVAYCSNNWRKSNSSYILVLTMVATIATVKGGELSAASIFSSGSVVREEQRAVPDETSAKLLKGLLLSRWSKKPFPPPAPHLPPISPPFLLTSRMKTPPIRRYGCELHSISSCSQHSIRYWLFTSTKKVQYRRHVYLTSFKHRCVVLESWWLLIVQWVVLSHRHLRRNRQHCHSFPSRP